MWPARFVTAVTAFVRHAGVMQVKSKTVSFLRFFASEGVFNNFVNVLVLLRLQTLR
jgi:hypothetical protein